MPRAKVVRQDTRPLRELLRPEVEQPLRATHVGDDRRQHLRYPRTLLGQMHVNDDVHPIACLDLSYGGAQVLTPWPLRLPDGQRVTIRLTHAARHFEDDLIVVASESKRDGTALHLRI